ncbi:hypothetical protein L202_02542 [Cryptococcus amylolentus CBS 6039]|uniref:Uncharacterized protein n=1 Tax=Cryptococcus amylolentus CBS 6039 TaxID=1295533 RepID=A0A1E3I0Z2_9TREE|nr:hypothetical protein L202_02542 [Cryptococcus amylolentus CBS 6039]ODN82259.1 hypothetical protein L202_02542 [Cryptococcus amylolentus CBS 6039]
MAQMSLRELLMVSILESLETRKETQALKAKIRALTEHVAIPLTKEIKFESASQPTSSSSAYPSINNHRPAEAPILQNASGVSVPKA